MCLGNWWRHKLYDISSIIPKAMTEGEWDEGKSEIQKFKYLENENNFLDEVKSIF